mgnify:CR=1 FL=1
MDRGTLTISSLSSGPAPVFVDPTVSWTGPIAAGGSVEILIEVTVTAAVGTVLTAQGTYDFDRDGVGGNDAMGLTDSSDRPCRPPFAPTACEVVADEILNIRADNEDSFQGPIPALDLGI